MGWERINKASLYFLHIWRDPLLGKGFLSTRERTALGSTLGIGDVSNQHEMPPSGDHQEFVMIYTLQLFQLPLPRDRGFQDKGEFELPR